MKRLVMLAILLCFIVNMPEGYAASPKNKSDLDFIKSYKDIPNVTQEEIDAIEAIKKSRTKLYYASLVGIDAFILENGSYAGFTIKLCKLLTDLFGIEFVPELHEWNYLKSSIDSRNIDFTGELTQTPERLKFYYMTRPIAQRAFWLYTPHNSKEIMFENEVNGLKLGFLKGAATAREIKEFYSDLSYTHVEVDGYATVLEKLKNGEIDGFVNEGTIGESYENYGFVRGKEFFTLARTSVSMTTANPDFKPIISVMNKYLSAGGIDKLHELYLEGNNEHIKYRLHKSFTKEEKDYLKDLAARKAKVGVAFESDNYPVSFYNETDKEFQGIAVDVLKKISELTGIEFEAKTTKDSTWAEILEKLKKGEISVVSELLRTEKRKDWFIWADTPYSSTHYALISKSEYPAIATYQVTRLRVGSVSKSAYEDMYNKWFPGNGNLITYATQNECLDALEKGEFDLLMASEHILLNQINYREKSGYRVNIRFNNPMNSYFGFNKNEKILCSIISKAQTYAKPDVISSAWTSRVFDYSKKLSDLRATFLLFVTVLLILLLTVVVYFYLKAKKSSKNLEETVKRHTNELEKQALVLSDTREELALYNNILKLLQRTTDTDYSIYLAAAKFKDAFQCDKVSVMQKTGDISGVYKKITSYPKPSDNKQVAPGEISPQIKPMELICLSGIDAGKASPGSKTVYVLGINELIGLVLLEFTEEGKVLSEKEKRLLLESAVLFENLIIRKSIEDERMKA